MRTSAVALAAACILALADRGTIMLLKSLMAQPEPTLGSEPSPAATPP
jgi:hypothetical protein